jgi:hypothetical protein
MRLSLQYSLERVPRASIGLVAFGPEALANASLFEMSDAMRAPSRPVVDQGSELDGYRLRPTFWQPGSRMIGGSARRESAQDQYAPRPAFCEFSERVTVQR